MAQLHLSLPRTNISRPSVSSSSTPSSVNRRRTIIAGVAQNLSYWDSIHSDIATHLKKAIPIREPISVFEPMHHLTLDTPKTTASALCVAACELVGSSRDDAIVAASAIHLMHAAMYTHDHLLLTDRVQPEPRIPHKFSPGIELMTGDGILPFGYELLAGSFDPTRNNPDKILRVIIEITRATGTKGMIDGQDDDAEFDQTNGQQSRQLHGCGAACGAILGGGSEEEIERLRRYGVYVGKIQGLLSETGKREGGKMELAEKWRVLAMKELESFDSKKAEQISNIVNLEFYYSGKP